MSRATWRCPRRRSPAPCGGCPGVSDDDPRAGPGDGPPARLRPLPQRCRTGQRPHPYGRGDRAAASPSGSSPRWCRAPRRSSATSGYDLLLYNLAGDASARHRVFETNLLTKRVDAVLVLSLKPSADERASLETLERPVTSSAPTCRGGRRCGSTTRSPRGPPPAPDRPRAPRIAYIGGATEGVLDFTAPIERG